MVDVSALREERAPCTTSAYSLASGIKHLSRLVLSRDKAGQALNWSGNPVNQDLSSQVKSTYPCSKGDQF